MVDYTPISKMSFPDGRGNFIRAEYVLVTPELAEFWLTRNIENNRIVQSKNVDNHVFNILNETFVFNGSTVKFDDDGNMMDGQHRLRGIVRSGVPTFLFVVFGLGKEALPTLDQEKPRSVADILQISKVSVKNVNNVIAVQMALMNGDRELNKLTTNRPVVAAHVEQDAERLSEWVNWATTILNNNANIVWLDRSFGTTKKAAATTSLLAVLGLIMYDAGANRAKIDKFVRAVFNGEADTPELAQTARAMRTYLAGSGPLVRQNGGSAGLGTVFRNMDTFIGIYNRWVQGESVKKVQRSGIVRDGSGKSVNTPIRWIDEIRDPITEGELRESTLGGGEAVFVPEEFKTDVAGMN